MRFVRLLWTRFLEFDRRLHGSLSKRYPTAIPTIDRWITAVVDRFLSSPVLAVVLAFVALILGVAGVRPLVLVSAGFGWIVCFLWAVRLKKLQELTIVTRLLTSVIAALVLAFGFWGLGSWALREHAREEASQSAGLSSSKKAPEGSEPPESNIPKPSQETPVNPAPKNPQQEAPLHPARKSESAHKLEPKVVPPIPQESTKPVEPQGPVVLTAEFTGPTSPAFSVYNPSADVVEGVLWSMAAVRNSDLCFFGFQTQKIDYIKSQSSGPKMLMELATMPRNAEGCDGSIKEGDELTGSISFDCPHCSIQTYIIHLVWKQSGWYFESDVKSGYILPKDTSKEARQLYIQTLMSEQFASKRIEIKQP